MGRDYIEVDSYSIQFLSLIPGCPSQALLSAFQSSLRSQFWIWHGAVYICNQVRIFDNPDRQPILRSADTVLPTLGSTDLAHPIFRTHEAAQLKDMLQRRSVNVAILTSTGSPTATWNILHTHSRDWMWIQRTIGSCSALLLVEVAFRYGVMMWDYDVAMLIDLTLNTRRLWLRHVIAIVWHVKQVSNTIRWLCMWVIQHVQWMCIKWI